MRVTCSPGAVPWPRMPSPASTKRQSKRRLRFCAIVSASAADLQMALIKDDKQPILLVPDNGPMTALASIRCLDWLLLPGVPVKITDQVAEEATRNPTLPWH